GRPTLMYFSRTRAMWVRTVSSETPSRVPTSRFDTAFNQATTTSSSRLLRIGTVGVFSGTDTHPPSSGTVFNVMDITHKVTGPQAPGEAHVSSGGGVEKHPDTCYPTVSSCGAGVASGARRSRRRWVACS